MTEMRTLTLTLTTTMATTACDMSQTLTSSKFFFFFFSSFLFSGLIIAFLRTMTMMTMNGHHHMLS